MFGFRPTCFAFYSISAVLRDRVLVLYTGSCSGLTAAVINKDYYYYQKKITTPGWTCAVE